MNDFHQNQPTLSRRKRLSRKTNGNNGGNWIRDFFGGFKLFFKWFFIGSFVVGVVLGCWAAYIYMTTEEYSLDALKKIQYSSVVLDVNNKEIGRLTVEGGDDRELVTLETLKKTNPMLIDTIKKVEDVRFDQHDGVDYYALGRAVLKNIVAMGKAEGGGTITMQVARNIILNSKEKSYTRKIREFAIAQNLGKNYSKDQILEAYLNYINFHPQIRGVGLAAKVYFNKDLNKDTLTPGEVAILAGLPKSPSMYNPVSQNIKTRKRSEERRNTVLGIMAREEDEMGALITVDEAGKFREKRIEEQAQYHKEHLREKGSAYLQLVRNELELLESKGELNDNSISHGLTIRTNLDPKVQQAVDKVLKNHDLYVDTSNKLINPNKIDAGITVLRKDGSIVAVGGGRQYQKGSLNRALEPVQPGSSIKPLTVYSPVIEKHGYNEHTKIVDKPTTVDGKQIRNFTGRYYGEIEFKTNVMNSLNASTVDMLREKVGLDTSYHYAKDLLELPLLPEDKNISPLALGGLTKGVSTLDMAQAYTVFPQSDGKFKKAFTIREIYDPIDEKTYKHKPETKDVFSEKTAYYMTRMLKMVVQNGSGTAAQIKDGRPTAGKTGTSQNEKDVWFVGYTTEYIAAVNVFNVSQPITPVASRVPAKIFSEFMSEVTKGDPIEDFKRPSGVEEPAPPKEEADDALQLTGQYNEESKAIQLSWTDLGEGFTYQLYRGEGEPTNAVPGVTGNSYSDTNVEVGKTYAYQVKAENKETGETLQSAVLTITIGASKEEKNYCDKDSPDYDEEKCKQQCEEKPDTPGCPKEDDEEDPNRIDCSRDREKCEGLARQACQGTSNERQCRRDYIECLNENGSTAACAHIPGQYKEDPQDPGDEEPPQEPEPEEPPVITPPPNVILPRFWW